MPARHIFKARKGNFQGVSGFKDVILTGVTSEYVFKSGSLIAGAALASPISTVFKDDLSSTTDSSHTTHIRKLPLRLLKLNRTRNRRDA